MDIKILFKGPIDDSVRQGAEIARHMEPDNAYIDTPAFTEGHTKGGVEKYGKSVYATNVDGWGLLKGLDPVHSAPIPYAYLDRAVASAKEAAAAGKTDSGVTATIQATEKLYWEQLAANLKDQGFEITFVAAESGDTSSTPSTGK